MALIENGEVNSGKSAIGVMSRLISGPQLRSCELKHKAKLLEFAIIITVK